MADHAELAVCVTANVEGIQLDYGVASLESVDRILGDFREDGLGHEEIGETMFIFGAYVGAVFVHSAGGEWVTVPDDHPLEVFIWWST